MNTTTISKGIASIAAAGAFFAVAACGTEISPEPNKISGSHQKQETEAPPQAPQTSIPRSDFGDEFGTPSGVRSGRPTPKADDWKGSGNRMDFGDENGNRTDAGD